jgi:hypothetical protein
MYVVIHRYPKEGVEADNDMVLGIYSTEDKAIQRAVTYAIGRHDHTFLVFYCTVNMERVELVQVVGEGRTRPQFVTPQKRFPSLSDPLLPHQEFAIALLDEDPIALDAYRDVVKA